MIHRTIPITAFLLAATLLCLGCNSVSEPVALSTAIDEPLKSDTIGVRSKTLISNITIFVLSVFVGFEIITKVPPTLHTPLMSGTNAIAGIVLVGALVATGSSQSSLGAALGFIAVILATINVVGGFVVTGRMLSMFQRRNERPPADF